MMSGTAEGGHEDCNARLVYPKLAGRRIQAHVEASKWKIWEADYLLHAIVRLREFWPVQVVTCSEAKNLSFAWDVRI